LFVLQNAEHFGGRFQSIWSPPPDESLSTDIKVPTGSSGMWISPFYTEEGHESYSQL